MHPCQRFRRILVGAGLSCARAVVSIRQARPAFALRRWWGGPSTVGGRLPGTNSRSRGWGDTDDQCLRFSVGAGTCRGTSRGWKGSDDNRDPMSWSAAWVASLAPKYQDSGSRWTSSGDRRAPRPPRGRWQTRVWREAREQSAFSLPVSCNAMSENVCARNPMCERRYQFQRSARAHRQFSSGRQVPHGTK